MNLPHIKPLELSRRTEPFDHPDWIFELKHDGFRGVAYVENGVCKLVSRKDNVFKSFGPLCSAIADELRVKNAIIDGEIVCLDADGRSVFNELLYRRGDPFFYAFDVLWLNGRDLRGLPLLERKRMLQELLERKPLLRKLVGGGNHSRILYAQHVETQGCTLFEAVCRIDLEGIVAKHRDGLYSPSATWLKIKNPNYTQAEGRHELFEQRRSFRLKPLDGGQPEGTSSANPT